MVLGICAVQRSYLKTTAFLQYMKVYRPRMYSCSETQPEAQVTELPDPCIGAFTLSPEWAQRLHAAGLPFWLIRPLQGFGEEIILKVVQPWNPSEHVKTEPAPDFQSVPAGRTFADRLRAYHFGARMQPWYSNPLKIATTGSQPASTGSAGSSSRGVHTSMVVAVQSAAAEAGPSHSAGPTRGPSMPQHGEKGRAQRHAPYSKPSQGKHSSHSTHKTPFEARDKFRIPDSPWMAPTIPGWERALATVDQSQVSSAGARPINVYVLPEPALLISSERRDVYLNHYQLMRDALQYLLGNPDGAYRGLTPQEWRDVLGGKVTE
ncbi:hypothetical protein MVEN_00489200 [Mycena venus]|uniref:Uncharacterized protein n=1 Tax=Mycena venus TaxID=2733690 RepID=A0A8H6YWR6_9AGAR|nr:hypothetical protein MVEN_00489200 [Mycena venus]